MLSCSYWHRHFSAVAATTNSAATTTCNTYYRSTVAVGYAVDQWDCYAAINLHYILLPAQLACSWHVFFRRCSRWLLVADMPAFAFAARIYILYILYIIYMCVWNEEQAYSILVYWRLCRSSAAIRRISLSPKSVVQIYSRQVYFSGARQ